ncbi:M1 family metallopeptidase [Colwellia hornerae]|uniref:M1 family metallopeptidase n=1 Tax=Colwellia hornerae TaxID=89402 RepID=A0A5C6QL66_9GAMM|nr:M1 family metallopeptidase [Colwellia hornerae]TWX58540.1 M1 family metallopeptidase [Colwellia hornerae]TWX59606.1 M1 family metallopeptidase [Colwellia hornerae]TWX69332.1 M1 family metallopeptidase [Colwellia hornerae]
MIKKTIQATLLGLACTLVFVGQAAASNWQQESGKITHQEKLRGTITPERKWWDLSHYHLDVKVDPQTKIFSGSNTMTYQVVAKGQRLQIELQAPMKLEKVLQNGQVLKVEQDGYSYFITPISEQKIGSEQQVVMYFSGQPMTAKNAPWDGGITWKKDSNGFDFIATSNQGIGSSIWWPNKDHPADEPNNGVLISVEVPEHLMDISNGRLIKIEHNKLAKTKTYHWQVVNPINNYGVNINIGDYVHFGEKYQGEKGQLDMDYYVLRENLAKAKKQFKDAKRTIEAFEHWFGPYPFYEDSYKLVEAPYLGMEHQSSVTYGNGYQNGYLGRDRSSTGPGLLFDFIIVHESGHEWFANNITNKDVADMWIHESFTNYSESLFLEYHFTQEQAFEYVRGQRMNIGNQSPIIGEYNANRGGSGDMYDKGGNMLHTIRQVINDDKKWREILRGLGKVFYHQTVTSQDIENYISSQSGIDLSKVFDQYLRDIRIPTFEYFIKNNVMKIRWGNVVEGFDMPLRVTIAGKTQWLAPTTAWTVVELEQENPRISVDANFYISTLSVLGN